jgi:hypothetical protein
LPEQLGVVFEYRGHHARQRLVMLDAGVLLVGVLPGILVGRVGLDAAWDVLGDQLVDAISIAPRDVSKLVVEGLENVGESVELRLWQIASERLNRRRAHGVRAQLDARQNLSSRPVDVALFILASFFMHLKTAQTLWPPQ